LGYHFCISLYGIYFFLYGGGKGEPWWDFSWFSFFGDKRTRMATLSLYDGFPYHQVKPGMAWYYLLQSAYNLDALLSLLELSFVVVWKSNSRFPFPRIEWSPTVRGDFREMFVHHVVTNLLVVGSSYCRLTRIGSMVFLVHDLSDVPVDLSKLANFLKYKYATIACFVSMSAVWFVTRLYVLPFVIYRSVLTQSHYVCARHEFPTVLYLNYRYQFYVLVAMLILLHAAWFAIFVRIFYTILTKMECHDYTEHKKGEKPHKQQQGQQGKSSNGGTSSNNVNCNGVAANKPTKKGLAAEEEKKDA